MVTDHTITTRTREWALRAALVFGVIVGTMLLLEGAARLWATRHPLPPPPVELASYDNLLYTAHPYLPYVLRPGYHKRGVTINALGLRGPEIPPGKPTARLRLLCLGESTTFGVAASDDAHTYPALLETVLTQRGPAPGGVQVINAGTPGYTSADLATIFALRWVDLRPDIVLVQVAVNDIRARSTPGMQGDYSHLRAATGFHIPWRNRVATYLVRTMRPFTGYSALARLLTARAYWHAAAIEYYVDTPASWGPERLPTPLPSGPSGTAWPYRRNLRSLLAIVRAHGGIPVLLTTPYSSGTALTRIRQGLSEHNDIIRELARTERIALIDLDREMSGPLPHFVDLMHMNDEGNALKARLIADALVTQGVLRAW